MVGFQCWTVGATLGFLISGVFVPSTSDVDVLRASIQKMNVFLVIIQTAHFVLCILFFKEKETSVVSSEEQELLEVDENSQPELTILQ